MNFLGDDKREIAMPFKRSMVKIQYFISTATCNGSKHLFYIYVYIFIIPALRNAVQIPLITATKGFNIVKLNQAYYYIHYYYI